jgi:thiosulfate/3-mercaptopyruvate sulfurtransferase
VIPSAVPVYWEDLLDPTSKMFKPAEELQAIFARAGLRPSDRVIAYCWVGHRSAVDLFALHLLGYEHLQNYLGSWEEWSKRTDLPTAAFKK